LCSDFTCPLQEMKLLDTKISKSIFIELIVIFVYLEFGL
jgi:hypothetical protein